VVAGEDLVTVAGVVEEEGTALVEAVAREETVAVADCQEGRPGASLVEALKAEADGPVESLVGPEGCQAEATTGG
jgi:uncharacterized protein with PIN domain